MSAATKLRRAWWLVNGISAPHPIGVEHLHTASGSCHNGHHGSCAVNIIRPFPKPARLRCSCPCHAGGRR